MARRDADMPLPRAGSLDDATVYAIAGLMARCSELAALDAGDPAPTP
ncbi:hypothetical protein HS041_12025 [Planomonospora sp. ID67723]|nr:hypothetical protein [Planomonospora sp. ID67723]MBG0828495.1 hypothetical protein [Planomonospora sp. ID67723]